MKYGKLTQELVDERILDVIINLQKARLVETKSLTDEEIVEEGLFRLINAKDEIEDLVKDIDPDRFAPYTATVLSHQKMNADRLNLCPICGHTRCTSDHK